MTVSKRLPTGLTAVSEIPGKDITGTKSLSFEVLHDYVQKQAKHAGQSAIPVCISGCLHFMCNFSPSADVFDLKDFHLRKSFLQVQVQISSQITRLTE